VRSRRPARAYTDWYLLPAGAVEGSAAISTPEAVADAGGCFLTLKGEPQYGELIDAGNGSLATLPLEQGAPATAAGAVALYDDTSRGEHLYLSALDGDAIEVDGAALARGERTEARAGMRVTIGGKEFCLERNIFAHA